MASANYIIKLEHNMSDTIKFLGVFKPYGGGCWYDENNNSNTQRHSLSKIRAISKNIIMKRISDNWSFKIVYDKV